MSEFNVLHPPGPSITVFKGWDVPGRKKKSKGRNRVFEDKNVRINSDSIVRLEERSVKNRSGRIVGGEGRGGERQRHFEFIPSSKPGTKNPKVQELVRRHVRYDFLHRTSHAPLQSRDQRQHPLISSLPQATLANPQVPTLIGHPTSLSTYNFPIPLSPSVHVLLESYLAHAPPRVYPLESCLRSNPMRSPEWFRMAVGDEAMLMGILYAGALYKAMREGRGESREMWEYEGRCVGVVRRRLVEVGKGVEGVKGGGEGKGDEGIGAVTCLALGEAIAGRPKLWRVHMEGIKEMLRLRRSKRPLAKMIEAKIRRADITGAIDYFTPPVLPSTHSSHLPIWDTLPTSLRHSLIHESRTFFGTTSVSPALIPILTDLVLFTQTIYFASENKIRLDPGIFTECLYELERKLLSFSSPLVPPSLLDSENLIIEGGELDKATRLASILYLKAILQEFPHSRTGPRVLLEGLRNALTALFIPNPVPGSGKKASLAWIATVGACYSGEEGEMRGWFVGFLRGVIGEKDTGGVVFEGGMERFLGLRSVFGETFEIVWSEVGSR